MLYTVNEIIHPLFFSLSTILKYIKPPLQLHFLSQDSTIEAVTFLSFTKYSFLKTCKIEDRYYVRISSRNDCLYSYVLRRKELKKITALAKREVIYKGKHDN